jgi:hypothetical protein
MFGSFLLDPYDRTARLYPAIFTVAPVVGLVLGIFSPDLKLLEVILAVGVGGGGAFFVAHFARDAGDKIQAQLFKDWDGMPSVAILRHRDKTIDRITKARYRKRLVKMVDGTKNITVAQEQSNHMLADETYLAWSTFLRVRTRGSKRFNLVGIENINFGYRKNMLGLRAWGIFLSALSLVGTIAMTVAYGKIDGWTAEVFSELITLDTLLFLQVMFWIMSVNKKWVKQAADAYACRLIESVENLK